MLGADEQSGRFPCGAGAGALRAAGFSRGMEPSARRPDRLVHGGAAGGSGEEWARCGAPGTSASDVTSRSRFFFRSFGPRRTRGALEREARAAGALNHPKSLTVYDVGEHRGARYLVTECLEGGRAVPGSTRGGMSTDEALDVGLQVARGLRRGARGAASSIGT